MSLTGHLTMHIPASGGSSFQLAGGVEAWTVMGPAWVGHRRCDDRVWASRISRMRENTGEHATFSSALPPRPRGFRIR